MHGLHVIMVFITLNRCRSLEFANIDVCSQRASIRPQQRIKLLDYAYLHATLNLTLITEVHADIVESYLLAKKELAETLSDSNANIATPDYAGFDTNYYVLQNKHHLNDADALCIAQGYRPLSLTRSEEFLALLKYLKARNIVDVHAPVMTMGDNLYNLRGEFVKQLRMETNDTGEWIEMNDTSQNLERSLYKHYPVKVRLTTKGNNFVITPGTFANHKAKTDIICETSKRSLLSTEYENRIIFRQKANAILKLGSKFFKAVSSIKKLSKHPKETYDSLEDSGYVLYPNQDSLKLRKYLRLIAAKKSWDKGLITPELLDKLAHSMKKCVKKYRERGHDHDHFFKLQVSNVEKFREAFDNAEFIDKTIFVKPLRRSSDANDHHITATVKFLLFNEKVGGVEIYEVMTNVMGGKILEDRYLTRIGEDTTFTSEEFPFPKLECRYGDNNDYCKTNVRLDRITSRGTSCAKELILQEIAESTACATLDYYGCLAYFINCGDPLENAIISCYEFSRIEMFCQNSYNGQINARAGITPIFVKDVVLKHENKVILAEILGGNVTELDKCVKPKGVDETAQLEPTEIIAICSGIAASAVLCIVGLLMGMMRKIYNKDFFCWTWPCAKKLKDQGRAISNLSIPTYYDTRGRTETYAFDNVQNANSVAGTMRERNRKDSVTLSVQSMKMLDKYWAGQAAKITDKCMSAVQGNHRPSEYDRQSARNPECISLTEGVHVIADIERSSDK